MASALDVRLANRIIARMGADVAVRISARSGEVAAALWRVPTDATLAVPADRVDWDALYGLYRALSGLPAVGVPRMTKVLHRKRPALVPILDEVVRSYLCDVEPLDLTGDAADQALTLTQAYHRELHHPLAELTLRQALDGRGIQLTECRILDVRRSGLIRPRRSFWRVVLWSMVVSAAPCSLQVGTWLHWR